MKKTLIQLNISEFPVEFQSLLKSAPIYDSSCSPQAKVYYIQKGAGFYLKRSAKGSLEKEAALTEWFHQKGLAAKVLDYRSDTEDWLLTEAVAGEDCTHYTEDPERLCVHLARILRTLHETDFSGCPVLHRTADYLATAEQNFCVKQYDLSYAYGAPFASAEEAWRLIESQKHLLKDEALLHGDYCLPNILLKDWKFSGFIDLGNSGVGDRHIDLYWAIWTLRFNLKTDRYGQRFKEAYGKALIDEDKLRLIGACEIFG